jgi:hypothetical protein
VHTHPTLGSPVRQITHRAHRDHSWPLDRPTDPDRPPNPFDVVDRESEAVLDEFRLALANHRHRRAAILRTKLAALEMKITRIER